MKLVVGLGNPGSQYNLTRHNLGFLVLDFYAKVEGLTWEKTTQREAVFLEFSRDSEKILFIKPQTFYNNSGAVVQQWLKYYKISPEQTLVVCDDFCLEFGKLRWRAKGSDGGNNGLKSVEAELGTNEFARLRVGTANDELRQRMGDTDFVLGKFTLKERGQLPDVLMAAKKCVEEFL